MPVYLRVKLTEEEKKELLKLKQASLTPVRTRTRIETLILSDRGLSVKQIAEVMNQNKTTIRRTIKRWIDQGKEGLFDQPRTGRPRNWQEEDIEYLENCLEKEERTYNSRQLVEKLKQERSVEISRERLRKILKKEWRWKRTKTSLEGKQKEKEFQRKKEELETLKSYAEEGYIKLKYLDEAGFCLSSQVSYSYSKKGEHKLIKQPKKRGKRLSILGILGEK
jgi:transposase